MTDPAASPLDDPVVLYDVMREAGSRLCAFYIARRREEGPDDVTTDKLRAISAWVQATDPHDTAAQRLAYVRLVELRAALTAAEDPGDPIAFLTGAAEQPLPPIVTSEAESD